MNIEDYKASKKVVKKVRLKKQVKTFINKCLLIIVIFLVGAILVKKDINLKNTIIKYVYEDNFKFTRFKKIYDKYFGKYLSIDKIVPKEEQVFSEKLSYNKVNSYKEGVKLGVGTNYMVPTIESGIIVYMGNKKDYGNTIIIEQIDGVDVWYSNIENSDKKMYDYIEKGSLLGEVKGNNLYLVFQKEGKFLNYKDYI